MLLATLSAGFTAQARASDVLAPADQERVAAALEEDAELMSTTQLAALLADEPPAAAAEVVRINEEVRPRALQAALLVPLVAGVLGAANALRMRRAAATPARTA